jgi:hypothetical protein
MEIAVKAFFRMGTPQEIITVADNGRTLQANDIGNANIRHEWLANPNFVKAIASDGMVMNSKGFWSKLENI